MAEIHIHWNHRVHSQTSLQHRLKQRWLLIICEIGISCTGGLLPWILGLICLENGNMTFSAKIWTCDWLSKHVFREGLVWTVPAFRAAVSRSPFKPLSKTHSNLPFYITRSKDFKLIFKFLNRITLEVLSVPPQVLFLFFPFLTPRHFSRWSTDSKHSYRLTHS